MTIEDLEQKIGALENEILQIRDGTIVGTVANATDATTIDGKSIPNTIANILTNHTKTIHDALSINAGQVDGKDLPNTIANILTNHTKAIHDALGIDHGSLGGRGDDDHSTIYLNNARHDTTTRHPVSVIKLSTGSYSEDISFSSSGTRFTTNKYGHQIEVKGESTDIQVIENEKWAVTTSWVAFSYRFYNVKSDAPRSAYAQWSYHASSQQAIWGIWDKDEKKLVCVLVEEDEGYCKLYPELKDNQKLIKIKNPKKYEKLFAWDVIALSKEKKINEEELEEI